jgi:hypothetical protein
MRGTARASQPYKFSKKGEQSMKSKLIIGLMISSLLVISASGQKLKTVQEVILQDDESGDHLIFVISDGSYKFESCKENFAISGVGRVSITGCTIDLQDISDDRRVLVEVDLCQKSGKADIAFQGNSFKNQSDDPLILEVTVSDSNTGDSAFGCESKQIEPKL